LEIAIIKENRDSAFISERPSTTGQSAPFCSDQSGRVPYWWKKSGYVPCVALQFEVFVERIQPQSAW
jgi:hypothetical protein